MTKLKEKILFEKISKLCAKRDSIIKKINNQINKKQIELDKTCTHSEVKTRDENYEGGYDYVARYNKITECKIWHM